MINFTDILPYLGIITSFIMSFLIWWSGRKKGKADEAQVLTGTALTLVQELKVEIKELRLRVDELETLIQLKDGRIVELEKQRIGLSKKQDELEEHSVWRDNELLKAIDRIQQLEHERAELEAEIVMLNDREDRRKEDHSQLVSRVGDLASQLSVVQRQRDELQIKVEIFQEELDKRDLQIQKLQERIIKTDS